MLLKMMTDISCTVTSVCPVYVHIFIQVFRQIQCCVVTFTEEQSAGNPYLIQHTFTSSTVERKKKGKKKQAIKWC